MRINDALQLTPFERDDKPNLLRYMNDSVLYANTLRVPSPYTETDADNWLAITEKEVQDYSFPINWAVRSLEHGVIGGIGSFLHTGLEGHRDEIGYWLASPFRGAGMMTEIVGYFCQYLFESRPTLVRIEARVFSHNPASVRLLEKVGFEHEGFAKKLHLKNGVYLDTFLMVKFRA